MAEVRQSGKTVAEEVTEEQAKDLTKPVDLDNEKPILTPRFHRMRLDFDGPDADVLAQARSITDRRIKQDFSDAYDVMFEIYLLVRNPVADSNGEVIYEADGMPRWERNDAGAFIEDWTQLNSKQRERFIYMIMTRMFDWEQKAADIWLDAVFAKAAWEEANANGFETLRTEKRTDRDKEARGVRLSAEHRYFAVFKSGYSRKAEGIVHSMDRILQRLKDIHTA